MSKTEHCIEMIEPTTQEIVDALLEERGQKAVIDYNEDGKRMVRLAPFKCSFCRRLEANGGDCAKGYRTNYGCDKWEYNRGKLRNTIMPQTGEGWGKLRDTDTPPSPHPL